MTNNIKYLLDEYFAKESVSIHTFNLNALQSLYSKKNLVKTILFLIICIAVNYFSGYFNITDTLLIISVIIASYAVAVVFQTLLLTPLIKNRVLNTNFRVISIYSTVIFLFTQVLTIFLIYGEYSSVLVSLIILFSYLYFLYSKTVENFFTSLNLPFSLIVKTINVIPVIIPILFAIVLFAVFSEELWKVLGQLGTLGLILMILFIFVTNLIILVTSTSSIYDDLFNKKYSMEELFSIFENSPLIQTNYQNGYISEIEMENTKANFIWRHPEKLNIKIESLNSATRKQLFFFQMVFNIILVLSFSVYLSVFFVILLDPKLLSLWIEHSFEFNSIHLTTIHMHPVIFNYSPEAIYIKLKVSFLIALLLTTVINIQIATSESLEKKILGWLLERRESWLAFRSVHSALEQPNYQVIEKTGNHDSVTYIITVPHQSAKKEIEKICATLAKEEEKNYKQINIIAYKKRKHLTQYKPDSKTTRWTYTLSNNPLKTTFTENSMAFENEDHLDHTYGLRMLKLKKEIEDKWFGVTETEQLLGKSIWQSDLQEKVIQHPIVKMKEEGKIEIDLHLTKKLFEPEHYLEICALCANILEANNVTHTKLVLLFYFRETYDKIAEFKASGNYTHLTLENPITRETEKITPHQWEKIKDSIYYP